MARQKPHYTNGYMAQARALRHAAHADPSTRCWRCGRTLAEARQDDPSDTWQAGHLVDGEVGGALAPEHRSCNARAGQRARERKRHGYDW